MEIKNEILLAKPFIKAILMVRGVYPTLNQVYVNESGSWGFSQDGEFAPAFDDPSIDTKVLKDMVDYLYSEVKTPITIKYGHIPNCDDLSVYTIKEALYALNEAYNTLTIRYLHVAEGYEDISKQIEERIHLFNTLLDIHEDEY